MPAAWRAPTVNPLGGWANGTFQDGIWYMISRLKFLGPHWLPKCPHGPKPNPLADRELDCGLECHLVAVSILCFDRTVMCRQ